MTADPGPQVTGIRFAAGTSEEEVAAVLALLSAAGPAETPEPTSRGGWSDPARGIRTRPRGPWRAWLPT